MKVNIIKFESHGDNRGQLVAINENKDISFDIKRVYYMYETTSGVTRGKHAHKSLEQILICTSGSCKVLLDDGYEKKTIVLNNPSEGLYIGSNIWREMFDFSNNAVLMVLASDFYDESDYIRDYNEFMEFIKNKK